MVQYGILKPISCIQKQPPEMFYEKTVLKNIAKFTGKRSIIPELRNRVTHYDVTNRVTNSKILFFLIFRVSNSM